MEQILLLSPSLSLPNSNSLICLNAREWYFVLLIIYLNLHKLIFWAVKVYLLQVLNLGSTNYLLAMWNRASSVQFSSVSHVRNFVNSWTAARQASLSITTSRACSNSCLLSQWYHPTISSSVIPFSSCLQSFPASGSFWMSWPFASDGQSIGTSTSVLPMNIRSWFPLGWTGLISLQSKGLSRVFSSTTVQKHQYFSAQLSLWFNSHIQTWLLENHSFD